METNPPTYRPSSSAATSGSGTPESPEVVQRLRSAVRGTYAGGHCCSKVGPAPRRAGLDNLLKRLPALATELANLKCDILFGAGPEANLAALTQSSRDMPIVVVVVDFDPIATGDVANLSQPGGPPYKRYGTPVAAAGQTC